jgi:PhnB protein
MAVTVKPLPDGYPVITPYLCMEGASQAIDFYKSVFGATERMRMPAPDGKIGHAEIDIGGSVIMLADEFLDMQFRGPKAFGGSPIHLHLYVENVDGVIERAMAAGAKLLRPVKNQFYGDRSGTIEDPFGHVWHLATHIEDLTPEELFRRAERASKDMAGG